jgi:hypothetical protein
MKVIGSMILLGAAAGAVVLVIQLTSKRDPETGRTVWRPLSRIALSVGAVFGTSLIVSPILRTTGLDPRGQSSSEQLRDELEDAGFREAEINCVEDRFVTEHGDLEAAEAAVEADAKVLLRAVLGCKQGLGITDEYADCFADGIADRFDIEDMGAKDLALVSRFAGEEDRKALAAVGLVCQGVPPNVADCVIERMDIEYPRLFEAERMAELTAPQEDFMVDAAAECAADGG